VKETSIDFSEKGLGLGVKFYAHTHTNHDDGVLTIHEAGVVGPSL
jgi:hypothetical protein